MGKILYSNRDYIAWELVEWERRKSNNNHINFTTLSFQQHFMPKFTSHAYTLGILNAFPPCLLPTYANDCGSLTTSASLMGIKGLTSRFFFL